MTFAVDWEFKPWLRLRNFSPRPGNSRIYNAAIAGSKLDVLLTGIGPANAAHSVRSFVDEPPDLCITSGLAGGLKPQYRPGEILAARATRSEDAEDALESDAGLFRLCVEHGAKPVNQFISTGRVVRTAREKFRLKAFADAVDMESFAIMKRMSSLGVPCVAVRTVSDTAETDVPCDFDQALDDAGRIRIVQVLGQVASDLRQVWPLARMGMRSSRAAAALARYLDGFTASLARDKEKRDLSVQHISL